MRAFIRAVTAFMVLVLFASSAVAQRTIATPAYVRTGGIVPLVSKSEVVVVGRVVEIEPDQIDVPAKGRAKDTTIPYKVAVVKIEESLMGAPGLTRVRVGFPLKVPSGDWTTLGMPLSTGIEACFSLKRHQSADFYVLAEVPLDKKEKDYERDLVRVKKLIRAVNDPVAALKAKELNDRFQAARAILQHYLKPHGSDRREPIPDEENKLIVALLTELPWSPKDGAMFGPDHEVAPCRRELWYSINPGEFGFKRPDYPKRQPGDPPVDFDKLMDEASTAFLKENGDKIHIKRFVQK